MKEILAGFCGLALAMTLAACCRTPIINLGTVYVDRQAQRASPEKQEKEEQEAPKKTVKELLGQ